MKILETIESIVKYCQRAILEIKSRQNIKATKIKLEENFATSTLTISFPTFDTKIVRVVFTPTNSNNQYSELGIRYWVLQQVNAPYFEVDVASDPSYATNTNAQAWLISMYNGYGTSATANLNVSVVSPSSGTITMTEI